MKNYGILLTTAILLAACVSIREVPTGSYTVVDAYEVKLGQTWGEMPASLVQGITGKILTIDGPQLNRLQLVGNLKTGDTLVKEQSKEKPAPKFNTKMTSIEIVDFIVENLEIEGFQNVKTQALRPSPFGTAEGTRFDIAAASKDGLKLTGTAVFSIHKDKLNIILYVAPEEYYYALRIQEVENIMRSVRVL